MRDATSQILKIVSFNSKLKCSIQDRTACIRYPVASQSFVATPTNTTMKFAILATLLAGAAAFAPVSQKASSSALSMAFENELGAQPPLGFYDPLGLVADGDQTKFNRLRYVELKHGRISMLAVAGYLYVESGGRLPGDIDYAGTKFTDIPNGFAALTTMPQSGVVQILLFIGFLEVAVMKETIKGEFPGDFRNGALDFGW
jgi:Chlorophyll A-B binding protein